MSFCDRSLSYDAPILLDTLPESLAEAKLMQCVERIVTKKVQLKAYTTRSLAPSIRREFVQMVGNLHRKSTIYKI